ncbi:RNA-guided endonuclease InsQ/TnpB family protein [Bifidobacterium felsineum]|uniref:RNA-guided endonuclease InsQ/TnpB family protein n=1 Tax=Bifidobacterium felsineum TaxID=2045440 RepID=UPI001BDCEF93|nr:RNA-guided endonuclease TnpB family protein [Bifidobacterium felsineum]MBT1164660.1 transposase [Bifidobacterium felsineum]
MSRKYRITRVDITGATPYLGHGRQGAPVWSKDPDRVMGWLCDAWRFRFNQHRSQRSRYLIGTHAPDGLLEPLGNMDTRNNRETREDYEWTSAVPDLILLSPWMMERKEWFAAVKRRDTNLKHGRKPGRMPGFKRRKQGRRFTCLNNHGKGYKVVVFNRKHAMVVIGGVNPKQHRPDGARFRICIHFRLSRPVLDSTSIHVDWTRRTISFTHPNPPRPHTPTGAATGIDVGSVHEAALSDGRLLDLPKERIRYVDKRINALQRAQARCVRESPYDDAGDYLKHGASNRYRRLGRRIRDLNAYRMRLIVDRQHKISGMIVDEHDLIVMEALQTANMTRRPKPKPDPDRPDHWLPNGRNAKRGLNKGMREAALSRFRSMIEYKAREAGVTFLTVNPAYTSQTCSRCGHMAKENRESQAVFHCRSCGYEGNADVNAAVNILTKGLGTPDMDPVENTLSGRDTSETRNRSIRPSTGQAEPTAVSSRRETTVVPGNTR